MKKLEQFLCLSVCLLLLAGVPVTASEVETTIKKLEPRPGGMFRVEITDPDDYFAAAILLQGGKGKLKIRRDGVHGGKRNFLVHHRAVFAQKGLLIAVADAPKDHYGKNGMKEGGFRITQEHATDLASVIALLRQKTSKPIWLIGTSRGSISAVNTASRLEGQTELGGLVLTASVVKQKVNGYPQVFNVNLDKISIPVLIAHHVDDACPGSPYDLATALEAAFPSSTSVEFKSYEGGQEGDAEHRCNRFSHHGFMGLEETVIDGIVRWIKGHS